MTSSTLSSPAFSDEEKALIEQQIERLVNNAHFSHSRRFPSFLRYVVSETLAGNTDQLKERTLGIEIFGKDADYDTSTEPIVRVTAAEIRKRIAQYYQEPGHSSEMRVSLPPGSYVPQFEFPAPPTEPEPAAAAIILPSTTATISAAANPRRWRLLAPIAAVLLLCIVGFAWFWTRPSPVDRFWKPILSGTDPILFCVADQTGYGTLFLRDAADPAHQVQLKDSLTAVVIDDLSVITKISGVLEASGRHYILRGENATTLSDLRNGPSIMVGAFDNAWTLRLLNPLRYHFANNPAMTSFSIVDSRANGHAPWIVSRLQQMATNNYEDYAIVARFTDQTTGKPTLIAAGIGRGGTIAAGEFLTSPTLLREVESRRPSSQAQNVEVVLSTRIIGGEPGTATVEAVYYW